MGGVKWKYKFKEITVQPFAKRSLFMYFLMGEDLQIGVVFGFYWIP